MWMRSPAATSRIQRLVGACQKASGRGNRGYRFGMTGLPAYLVRCGRGRCCRRALLLGVARAGVDRDQARLAAEEAAAVVVVDHGAAGEDVPSSSGSSATGSSCQRTRSGLTAWPQDRLLTGRRRGCAGRTSGTRPGNIPARWGRSSSCARARNRTVGAAEALRQAMPPPAITCSAPKPASRRSRRETAASRISGR